MKPIQVFVPILVPCLALAACGPTSLLDDGGFQAEHRGGQLHDRAVAIDLAQMRGADDPSLLAPALEELADVAGPIEPAELTPLATAVTPTAGGGDLVHVSTHQQIDGIPIDGTWIQLSLLDAPGGARLVGSAYHLYEAPRVDTLVTLDRDAAVAVARDALRADPDAAIVDEHLAIAPLDDGLATVWEVTIDGADVRALVRAAGDRAGEVVRRDDRVYADGVVDGTIAVGGAPGGHGTPSTVSLDGVEVDLGSHHVFTDATGHFDLSGSGTVTVRLAGQAADIRDHGGGDLTASHASGTGLHLVLGGSGEAALAQATAYHAIAATRDYAIAAGIPVSALGAAVMTKTDLPDTCNAYFDPAHRTLNFFHSGGGCRNSAETSIVAHEYGHFIDDAFGGIQDGGLSEGWGDVLSCLSRRSPVIGPDLQDTGEAIRRCDNDYVYPRSGQDEVHALGQAWSGFVWDARAALIASLGASRGEALIERLVLPSFVSNAPDIPSAVREVFLRDDDDGDLHNHTPHWNALWAAADKHGLTFALDGDVTAPARVTDLAVASTTTAHATLRWTAPGDDGSHGSAAAYDLRIATAPITDATFALATKVAAPDPLAAGKTQQATVAFPAGAATVWVALRSIDDAGNTSATSNVVSFAPGGAPPPDERGLVINEILADPPAGYDSGGDGTASTTQDEFVELVNAGSTTLDLSGWTLADSVRTRVTFAQGTSLAPGRCLVVLGGGAAHLTGVATVIADGGLSLNNDGDTVRVRRAAGDVAAEVSYGAEGGHDQSLVRSHDGDPSAPMVGHLTVSSAPASPGRRSDGSAF